MKKSFGFTLIELLLCLSIFAVLMCFGYFMAMHLVQKNWLATRVSDVKSAIRYAKMHALSFGEPMILTHLPLAKDWSEGLVLRKDTASHPLVHEWHWDPHGIQVTWQGFQSRDYLLFTPKLRHNAVNGTFMLQDTVLKHQHSIVVNRLGHAHDVPL